jgi:hypothetical protein
MDRTGLAGRSRPKVRRDFVRSRLEGQFVSRAYEILIPIRQQAVATRPKRPGEDAWQQGEPERERTTVGA